MNKKMVSMLTAFVMGFSMLVNVSTIKVSASSSGLAKTPPMGWNSWNSFHGDIDENKIKAIADVMASQGMKDAGYVYLNLDDNWMANPARDSNGNLIADPKRFPSGMKSLADYVHSKGLKLGIYGDHGSMTCMNVPQSGSYGHEKQDAATFASWDIDYLKYDNGNIVAGSDLKTDYQNMQNALTNCGRNIVFSICAWEYKDWMPATGELWRTTGDITDKWDNGSDWFHGIINAIDDNSKYASAAGPGGWNDPDMLEIGNGGCTTEEYRTQFSMWSMMASPLIAGNDIRNMTQATKEILLNTEVIAVDQDPLGKQCTKVIDNGDSEVYLKPLANGDYAVALLNRGEQSAQISVTAQQLGLTASEGEGYHIRDLWQHSDRGSTGVINATVPSHGTAMFRVSKAKVADLPAYLDMSVSSSNNSVEPGKTVQITTTLNNIGVKNVTNAAISLQVPDGWTATPLTAVNFDNIAVGKSVNASWNITPPSNALGISDIGIKASYTDGTSTSQLQGNTELTVTLPGGSVYISDLVPFSIKNGWYSAQKDKSNDSRVITLDGVKYNKGYGTNSPSEIVYNLDGKYETFISNVGIDDEVGDKGSAIFQVWGEETKLWDSGVMTGTDATKSANVDVKGIKTLKLVATDGGDGNAYDHADWAGARLIEGSNSGQTNDFIVKTTFNLANLQSGKMLDAKTIVTNNKSSQQSVMAIVALYDANDTMVNMSYISKNIAINGTESLNSGFKLPSNVNGYKVKVFVWDGENITSSNMQPLSNMVTLP